MQRNVLIYVILSHTLITDWIVLTLTFFLCGVMNTENSGVSISNQHQSTGTKGNKWECTVFERRILISPKHLIRSIQQPFVWPPALCTHLAPSTLIIHQESVWSVAKPEIWLAYCKGNHTGLKPIQLLNNQSKKASNCFKREPGERARHWMLTAFRTRHNAQLQGVLSSS